MKPSPGSRQTEGSLKHTRNSGPHFFHPARRLSSCRGQAICLHFSPRLREIFWLLSDLEDRVACLKTCEDALSEIRALRDTLTHDIFSHLNQAQSLSDLSNSAPSLMAYPKDFEPQAESRVKGYPSRGNGKKKGGEKK